MHHTYVDYISPKACKYTLSGRNIAEIRRAELQRVLAKPLGVDATGPKNEILKRVIARLNALEAPEEITELATLSEPDD